MFDTPLLELLKLWGELVEAYHGKNGYGGRTAELYAYRFCPDDPRRRGSELHTEARKQADKEAAWIARNSLYDLCKLFAAVYDDAILRIDGREPFDWFQHVDAGFNHRVRVKVTRRSRAK